MSYSSQGLIEASDYNGFVGASNSTTSTELNAIWGQGTADMGYLQDITEGNVALTTDQVTQNVTTVTAGQWATLLNRINTMRQHQGAAAPYAGGDIPVFADTIEVVNNIQTNINACYTNRHSVAARGATVTGSNFSFTASLGSSNYSSSITRTVTFSSADNLRYFFNAGGELIFDVVSAANSDNDTRGNELESWLVTSFNSFTLRARTSVYGGTHTTAPSGWNTSSGFWTIETDKSSANTRVFEYNPGGTYTGGTSYVRLDVNTSTTNVVFTLSFAINVAGWSGSSGEPDASIQDIDTNTIITKIDFAPPSTTYLSAPSGYANPTIT